MTTNSDTQETGKLFLVLDPKDEKPENIAQFLSALNSLYQAIGGDELRFQSVHSLINQERFLKFKADEAEAALRMAEKAAKEKTKTEAEMAEFIAKSRSMSNGWSSLLELPGVGVSQADALYEKGFFSVEEISIASISYLMEVPGMTEEAARELIEAARQIVMEAEAELKVDSETTRVVEEIVKQKTND